MVLDLDATATGGAGLSRRFYSSFDPHSTGKKARNCASCHLSSWALGLGMGTLPPSGRDLAFEPASPAPDDPRMAVDAWTRLDAERPGTGTRVGLRSLDRAELQRTLAVGACLPCHEKAADRIYRDLTASKARLAQGGTRCTFHAPR
jgi:cytochrome c553